MSDSQREFSVDLEYVGRHRTVKPQLRTDWVALSSALGANGGILIRIDEVSSGKVRLSRLHSRPSGAISAPLIRLAAPVDAEL
jgi:hypothetical protein